MSILDKIRCQIIESQEALREVGAPPVSTHYVSREDYEAAVLENGIEAGVPRHLAKNAKLRLVDVDVKTFEIVS